LLNLSYNSSVEIRRNNPGNQTPTVTLPPTFHSEPDHDASADLEIAQKALKFYREGERLLEQKKFAWAAEAFRSATSIDPNLSGAYEGLVYALLRLKKYDESAEASNAAIRLSPAFTPYYNLGLAQYATGNWPEAIVAFQYSIEFGDTSSW